MSDVFFDELGIPAPAHNLGVSGGGHGAMTGAMLQALEPLMERETPDWVLVYGDTNSTRAGALAASKLHIPVAHVDRAAERSAVLAQHGLDAGAYILATAHRADNTDDPERLRAIVDGLEAVAVEHPVILPLHPRTRAALERHGIALARVRAIDPVGYLDMVALEHHAALIATDSGGVQKEAYFHGVPCVTLRDETEWTELVDLGWNRMAPPTRADIASEIRAALGTTGREGRPYGDGHAAEHIVRAIGNVPATRNR